MQKFRHFLTWLVPAASLLIFKLIFEKPVYIYWLSPILIFLVIITVYFLTDGKLKRKFWDFLISPVILVVSELLFIIFLQGYWLKWLVVSSVAIILTVFLENIYIREFKPEKYQKYSLANISNYLNLVIIFLFNASLYLFIVFFSFSVWNALILNFIVTLLLTYQIFSISRFGIISNLFFIFGIPLAIAEVFLAVSFLPFSVYNQSLIIALAYYLMIGFSRNKKMGISNKKVAYRYLGIAFVCLAVILITAKQR